MDTRSFRKSIASLIWIVLFSCFYGGNLRSGYAQAQAPNRFKHLTINEGLSQNTVFCILQDHKGFVWIGTAYGLNKYDGYEFTVYQEDLSNTNSLSNSQINALLEDKDGNLWIATAHGLNFFNRKEETFTRINTALDRVSETNNSISSLVQDNKNNIWFGTRDGLNLYNPNSKEISLFSPHLVANLGLNNNKVQTIYKDNQGMLWVSIGNDLKLFDPAQRKFLALPPTLEKDSRLRKGNVRIIRQDEKGNYWIGTENLGVFRYDPLKQECRNYRADKQKDNSLLSDVVREIFVADTGQVWLGTREGLSILNLGNQKFTNIQYNSHSPDGLSHNSVRNIMKDNTGNIWIGTYAGGISVFNPSSNNFSHIGERITGRPGLNHRVVSSVLEDKDGALWVGTEGGGLNYIDRETNTFRSYPVEKEGQEFSGNIIKSLAEDKGGDIIWLGTYEGLVRFDKKSTTLKSFPIGVDANKQVHALLAVPGGIWIGTNGDGLFFMDRNERLSLYSHTKEDLNSLSSNYITSLLEDKEENIWVGTQHGLSYFNRNQKRFTRFLSNQKNPYSINHNTILSLFTDPQGRIWVGTEGGGINIFDKSTQRFYAITEKEGLESNVIQAIKDDNDGNVWVSTNKGISKIVLRDFTLPFQQSMLHIINYTVADGLQSNQFSRGAVEKGKSGELIFAGINGLNTFFPDKIFSNTHKPEVVFTDFFVRNKAVSIFSENSPLSKPINETQEIILTHDQGFINLKFAALNFTHPDKNQYAYKLKGLSNDEEWHFVGDQRVATYTNLDAGEYIFMVKAANNDGVWNEKHREIRIIVMPPWHKTWWAYSLYAIVIGALLYLFYYFSYKTAKLQNELIFEHMSHEKDQELAQRKMSFFTNISHEIKTPLTLILAPIEKMIKMNEGNHNVQNQLLLMQRNGGLLLRLLNQLLDFRKFESGKMKLQATEEKLESFLQEVVTAFESYALHRGISLRLVSQTDHLPVWFDLDKLEKVMYNLLSNALKFTQDGGHVYVRVKTQTWKQNSGILIEVEDDGIGIPAEHISTIFEQFNHHDDSGCNRNGTGIGLAFSKGLVELHRGKITAVSTPGNYDKKGYTCFSVWLPLGKAHLTEEETTADCKEKDRVAFYQELEIQPASAFQSVEKRSVLADSGKDRLIMLIVEDNPGVLDFVAAHFAETFEVHTAMDGLSGWQKATETIPDIIISDVMMPHLSGTDLCSRLKADDRTSHVPVILLTALATQVFEIEGLATGADDYITKPFNLGILEARVWNLLESRKKLRERYRKEINLQPRNIMITSPDERFLEKAMNFIENNLSESSLSVEELGKEVGMSRVTLYRKIKALTGQTAIEFIRNVRLKRAAQLLGQNNLNVSEVAYLVGFTDIDYFRKCFKEQHGHTPKEYAKFTSEK